jgi:glycosyltransferase involved in cell wall biosynthesis
MNSIEQSLNDSYEPLLSIAMITYRHEKYVAQALTSIFEQELPFRWELVISDDASDDNTATIIKGLIAGRENISFIRQPENLGMQRNYEFVMSRCRGEFVAQLEGDDYWTDPQKSIKQIALLRSHPRMMWCSTNGIEVDAESQWIKDVTFDFPTEFTLHDFAQFVRIPFNPLNNTVMFRKKADPLPYPEFVMRILQIDTALHYLRSRNGTIGFIQDATMAYRRHPSSSATRKSKSGAAPFLQWIILFNGLRPLLPKEIAATFDDRSAYFYIAKSYLTENDHVNFLRYWFKCMGHPTWRDSLHYLKLWLSSIYQYK